MISESEALTRILARVTPVAPERAALGKVLGRFSARNYTASAPLPAFDNSAMDGYAISSADLAKGRRLRVTNEQPAGIDRELKVNSGEAVRIFTGAPIPEGTAAVVMQEDVRRDGEFIVLSADSQNGE